LLKTIEEPPPYIVFIFATTELHKVPATIKSRCQQFNFRLISVETIQEILKKICAENNITAEDDALFWIAREATGSMRDAFTLFDQVVSFSAGNIRSDLIREKLGITGLEKLNALAENFAANDTQGAFTLSDEILSSGVAIEQFIIDLAGYFRSLLLLKNGITRESLLGYRPALFCDKALETFDSIRLEQALDILLDCYRNIRYSVSPRFELETAVSKLAWLSRWVSPVELKEAVDEARNILGSYAGQPLSRPPEGTLSARTDTNPAERASYDTRPANSEPTPVTYGSSGGRSLTDEFKLMVAAKESGVANLSDDDEDVPFWKSQAQEKIIDPEVERVMSVIPGSIVS
jgi:DNA polymerase-3 subunit gamma/tau